MEASKLAEPLLAGGYRGFDRSAVAYGDPDAVAEQLAVYGGRAAPMSSFGSCRAPWRPRSDRSSWPGRYETVSGRSETAGRTTGRLASRPIGSQARVVAASRRPGQYDDVRMDQSPIDRLLEALDRRDVDAATSLLAPDCELLLADGRHANGRQGVVRGARGVYGHDPLDEPPDHRSVAGGRRVDRRGECDLRTSGLAAAPDLPRAFVLRTGPEGVRGACTSTAAASARSLTTARARRACGSATAGSLRSSPGGSCIWMQNQTDPHHLQCR